jgi:hypothetical protein
MEDALTSFAFFVGALALGVPLLAAALNISRLFRGDHLVLQVDGEEFIINVGSLEEADLDVIDSATRAVEERARDRLAA